MPSEMTPGRLAKMEVCAHLLAPPAPEVTLELCAALRAARRALECDICVDGMSNQHAQESDWHPCPCGKALIRKMLREVKP